MLPKRKSHTVNRAPNNHRNQIIEKNKEEKKTNKQFNEKIGSIQLVFFPYFFSLLSSLHFILLACVLCGVGIKTLAAFLCNCAQFK